MSKVYCKDCTWLMARSQGVYQCQNPVCFTTRDTPLEQIRSRKVVSKSLDFGLRDIVDYKLLNKENECPYFEQKKKPESESAGRWDKKN